MLFDSEATHLCMSNECMRRLRLVLRELGCKLIVATPASICVGCPMVVADRRFKVNLICLPMEGLNVILGMDWLSDNHFVIDYERRRVVFPETIGLELIASQKAMKEV